MAVALVGGVLAMILGAVFVLDRAVANERVVKFSPAQDWATGQVPWGYQDLPEYPGFALAPSRLADAQAQTVWRQVQELYEQSVAVGAIEGFVVVDYAFRDTQGDVAPKFIGAKGYLSQDQNANQLAPLSQRQLSDARVGPTAPPPAFPDSLYQTLFDRFGPGTFANGTPGAGLPRLGNLQLWNPPASLNIDGNTLRTATIFFIGSEDRILGMLRIRAWQFVNTDPYRYYEVSLLRFRWEDRAAGGTSVNSDWRLLQGGPANIIQDFAYRFREDRRFPQDLIFPPTQDQMYDLSGDANSNVPNTGSMATQGDPNARNLFVRLARAGEDYMPYPIPGGGGFGQNTKPGVSRMQVSVIPDDNVITALTAPVDEWHLLLPDPSLSQAEDRARLRQLQGGFDVTIDQSYRRQGKYGCVFSIYP